jgi:hypothetical protein
MVAKCVTTGMLPMRCADPQSQAARSAIMTA